MTVRTGSGTAGSAAWRVLSFIGTPWVLFLSTSIPLYLRNQDDLYRRVEVLGPFVGLFAILFLAATGTLTAQRGRRWAASIWAYYLLGPLLLGFLALDALAIPTLAKLGLVGGSLALAARLIAIVSRTIPVDRVAAWFAIMGLAFAAVDSQRLMAGLQGDGTGLGPLSRGTNEGAGSGASRLPNVYHVLFDEFQTDMFTETLDAEVERELAGFVFFPETTTLYGRTGMSVPSVFSSRTYDLRSPQIDYQMAALNSESSVLHWLKQAGYHLSGRIHKAVFRFELSLFDEVILHRDEVAAQTPPHAAFQRLWVYATLPHFVASRLIDPEELRQLANQNLMEHSVPITSYLSWRSFLDREESLAAHGRYTYVHLILPHFPYVLSADCEYGDDADRTTPLEQAHCATRQILDLVRELKRLDRFDESMIVLQSDHGAGLEHGPDGLAVAPDRFYGERWSWGRARSLLLMKPPGRPAAEALLVSAAQGSLLDVAPSMVAALDLAGPTRMEGVSLLSPTVMNLERPREYFFYDKEGKGGWTRRMTRYGIEGSRLTYLEEIPLQNNPKR